MLAALLFILYINDVKGAFQHCKINLFADDTLSYIVGVDINTMVARMNEDLDKFYEWLKINKLKLNPTKTKFMVITHKVIDSMDPIKINGIAIERVSEMKYLGCIIDDWLNFDDNCDHICKKMGKKISFFGRIAKKLDKVTRILIYNTIIAPHINYCSTILYLSAASHIERVQKLQNRCMRIILRKNKRTRKMTMLNDLGWLSIEQKIHFDILIWIYKIRNGQLPKYLGICFQSDEGRSYITRSVSNGDIRLPLFRKSSTQRSLMYNGVKCFNKLPYETKFCANINQFKKLCFDFVKNEYKMSEI